MSRRQERMVNPFGMDPSCTTCPELAEARTTLVHGYGDVTAEFLFIRARPPAIVDDGAHPLTADPDVDYPLIDVLDTLGFLPDEVDEAGKPRLENAFLTHLTRCRHPERDATDAEIGNCAAFLTADIRSINPELLVPIGTRPLDSILAEYSTTDPSAVTIEDAHGTEIRGRGFEICPMLEPATMDAAAYETFIDTMTTTLDRDYRQTKGRRGR